MSTRTIPATQQHSIPDRLPLPESGENGTTESNTNGIRYGNCHGSISFGHIDEYGTVTSSFLAQGSDARQSICLDETGIRKGWISMTAPGNFSVSCGEDKKEEEDSLCLFAENGNIIINAGNGKIRMEADDIEIISRGVGTSKGNIRLTASETVEINSKKFIADIKSSYKIATAGIGEIVANSQLQIYSSLIRGVTDACSKKDSKNNHQRIQRKFNNVV